MVPRRRRSLADSVLLAGLLLAWSPCAFALDPALDVSQYAHTSWKIREGFTKGAITSIVQTPDGYLWLGTEYALLRFDGVRAVPWQPPPNQHLASSEITYLLTARDGTLWIGTAKGLASWKDGRLTQYSELAGQKIKKLFEDRDGTVWAGGISFPPPGKLCAIHNGSIECFGEDGSLGNGVVGLFEDSKGTFWVGGVVGLWRWKPGPPKFYPLPSQENGISGLAEDQDGSLLISMPGGIRRVVDGKTEMAYPFPDLARQFEGPRLLRDRDGGLWIGTRGRGLVHVHRGRTDVFAQSDGLSSENVFSLFEDREGNIWVGTFDGLDRFRELAVPTFSVKQGLSNALAWSVLAARDGSVWLATTGDLNHWQNGQISTFDRRHGKLNGAARTLFQDARGRMWVSTPREFGYLENDRFNPVKGVPGGWVNGIAEDTAGNLWIADMDAGLFQLFRGNVVQQIPWAKLGHKAAAFSLAADPLRGGLWLGFVQGGIAYFSDGQVRASYSAADGLGEGLVSDLRLDLDGTLWAATEGGLSRLKDGRIATLRSSHGLPCDGVYWTVEDDAHALWLSMTCGLLRIARSELDASLADSRRTIQVTVFDNSDGVRISTTFFGYGPQVTKTSDGKLWFRSLDGVSVVDPQHLAFNNIPSPVHIEQIIADRQTYDATSDAKGQLHLPPLIRDLQIDYTALSLVAPEKVLFRYKLEGWDQDWQDVGNRRKAFYNNLPPRNYRFRVMACNNSGVWNEAGAFLDFSIAPAYYQTIWFRASVVVALASVMATLYRMRVRRLALQFNARMEERVNERTRIARDLHDTLLQSFHGLVLRFQAAALLLPDRPAEARATLDTAIDSASQAMVEGRDAVLGLRPQPIANNDLAEVMSALGDELSAADRAAQPPPHFRVRVEGTPRDLATLVRDEVYRIAREALRNAFQHARATGIEVEIRYELRQFRLRVRDDGMGIEPAVFTDGGRAGHYGLAGMRERAELLGGTLAVWSKPDAGTEMELSLPGSVAYGKGSR
jgi:signal transduction histidine kinase/ligand-binding sensor domain-containing protein